MGSLAICLLISLRLAIDLGEGSRGLAFVVYSFTYAFCVAFLVIRTRTLLVQKRGYGAAASASQSIIIGQKAAKLAAFLVLLAWCAQFLTAQV